MNKAIKFITRHYKIILILIVIAGIAGTSMIPKENVADNLPEYLSED